MATIRYYTPAVIDEKCCMARTWNDGKGGQCTRPRAENSDLCAMHIKQRDSEKGLVHGRVDGEVPEKKLEEFKRAAEKPEKPKREKPAKKASDEKAKAPMKAAAMKAKKAPAMKAVMKAKKAMKKGGR